MDNINTIADDIEGVGTSKSLVCSPEETILHVTNATELFKVMHVNIRSINCNFNSLLVLLNRLKHRLDLIVLSECWLSKSPCIPSLDGFNLHASSYNSQNEGIVVYIRSNITYTVKTSNILDANSLSIIISNSLAVIAIYRPPSYKNLKPFISSLDSELKLYNSYKNAIIVGDLNINIVSGHRDSFSDEYLNMIAANGMLPAHNLPTRLNSCLDHVMVRSVNPVTTLVLDTYITDHAPIIFYCDTKIRSQKVNRTTQKLDVQGVVAHLERADFSPVFMNSDPDKAADLLVNTISDAIKINSHTLSIPNKKRIIKPWITPGLLRCIRHRDRLYRKVKKQKDNLTLKAIFIRYRNFCNNILKRVKQEYERNEFQKARNNPGKTWHIIKKVANLKQKEPSSSALLNLCSNPINSVKIVNNFFASVGKNLADNITAMQPGVPTNDICYPHRSGLNAMALLDIDSSEIEDAISNLKDKCAVGWDCIPSSVIKASANVLIPVLQYVFNLCIRKGIFPKAFKKAVVHPIYKSGDRGSVTNYRPISVLTTLSKIFEKILNKRLLSYINKNNILSFNQFGFRSGKSTEDAVLKLTENILNNIENKLKSVAIYLDLSKAFDTVSIPKLLDKLEKVGIRGLAFNIFKSYLTDRTQCVKLDTFYSDESSIDYGVPQGSVLGPTLFLIYINELCSLPLPNCKIITYADDTVLLISGKTWQETQQYSETSLQVILSWLRQNLLTLNIAKTKYITFASSSPSQAPPSFNILAHSCPNRNVCNCLPLERTQSTKYLGVIMDGSMTWNQQIDSLVARLRKLVFVFKRLRNLLDLNSLKTVYFSLAQSILTYCITCWGGSGQTSMMRLERAQRLVLKIMCHKPSFFPTAELYANTQVLTVRKLFILHTILRKHPELPFDPIFKTKRRSHLVATLKSTRTAISKRHYPFLSCLLYNRINKLLNISPLTTQICKSKCSKLLQSLSYEETEKLLKTVV